MFFGQNLKKKGKREGGGREQTGRKQQIAKYWESQPSSRIQKIQFQVLLSRVCRNTRVKWLLRDSFSCIGGIDANYTKENELHRTDYGGLTWMAHPAGKELRNSSTATENSLIEPTVLLQNIQFTQEENSKAEHLRPRFPLFQNSVPPIGLQSFWRCFVHLALKNSTFKTGLSKNILKPEKIPSQIWETRAWSCLC